MNVWNFQADRHTLLQKSNNKVNKDDKLSFNMSVIRAMLKSSAEHTRSYSPRDEHTRVKLSSMAPFPESAADWRNAIEDNATKLQGYLSTFADWGECPACGKAYPDALGPHITGKEHFKKLRWQVDGRKSWLQEWRNFKGDVVTFHHVTGEVSFVESGGAHAQMPITPSSSLTRAAAAKEPFLPPIDDDAPEPLASSVTWPMFGQSFFM